LPEQLRMIRQQIALAIGLELPASISE
jgi:hypothetical protein